jgi:hypothetical protein
MGRFGAARRSPRVRERPRTAVDCLARHLVRPPSSLLGARAFEQVGTLVADAGLGLLEGAKNYNRLTKPQKEIKRDMIKGFMEI